MACVQTTSKAAMARIACRTASLPMFGGAAAMVPGPGGGVVIAGMPFQCARQGWVTTNQEPIGARRRASIFNRLKTKSIPGGALYGRRRGAARRIQYNGLESLWQTDLPPFPESCKTQEFRDQNLQMKVHLTAVEDTELLELFHARSANCAAHAVVADPAAADLILLLGNFGRRPQLLLEHPAYVAYPERCAVYTEDDMYMPLAPGIFCSAQIDRHTRCGRIFSYAYVSRNGRYRNNYLAETSSPVGATPAAGKKYLFSFQGGSTSLVRKRLFKLNYGRPDILIENTSKYYHWDDSQPDRHDRQLSYANTLASSQFVLCPRGAGAGTIRLFEVMAAGVAPVLLSDGYSLPPGPAWDNFLLRVPEREIARLPELLEPQRSTAAERGRLAREAFLEHFSIAREFERVVELAALSLRHGPPVEDYFRRRQTAIILRAELHRSVRGALRSAALCGMKLLKVKSPYALNQSDD